MTTFNGTTYTIETTEDNQFVLNDPTNPTETFDSLDELIETHPVCEESRAFFYPEIGSADQFQHVLGLDYAVSLIDGLSTITIDSAVVSRLVQWSNDRGHIVSRDVCYDVLESQLQGQRELGIME